MSESLRTVLIGAGDDGASDHQRLSFGPALLRHPRFEVIGVAEDPNASQAERARSADVAVALGLTLLDTDTALEQAQVASVCTILERRVEAVTELAGRGVHLLLDKPVTRSAVEARAIAEAVEAAGVVAVAGGAARFHPAVVRAAAAVARGDLGLPWGVQGELMLAEGVGPWQNGALANGLSAALDIVRAMIGLDPVAVAAWRSSPFFGTADEDVAALSLTFEHDVPVSLTVGRTPTPDHPNGAAGDHRYRVMGSEGVLTVDLAAPAVRVNGGSGVRRFGAGQLAAMLDHFAASIGDRTKPGPGLGDAVLIAEVVDAARTSAEKCRTVYLDRFGKG